ncbi:MAG: M56 family metallopeptidase [Planctomycetaceae bacterium]
MSWLPATIQERLVIVLAHFVWQGVAVAALLAALVALLNLKRPSVRYASSLAAFLLMSACPFVTWFVAPDFGVRGVSPALDQSHNQFGKTVRADDRPLNPFAGPRVEPFDASTPDHVAVDFRMINLPPPQLTTETKPPSVSDWRQTLRPFEPWIIGVWLCGVGLLSLRLLLGAIGLWRWRRAVEMLPETFAPIVERLCAALSMAQPRVRVCRRVAEAVAIGLFKPMILLPAAWLAELPPDMLEAVLAHELAHVRRLDLWVNLLQRLVETLLFYHPAVWWLSRRLRVERELCCDELAATVTNDRIRYAETLEHVARLTQLSASRGSRDPAFSVAMSGREGVLLHRIRQLLDVTAPPRTSSGWLAGLLTLGLVLTIALGTFVSSRAEIETPTSELDTNLRAGRGSPDPALDSTAGLPNSEDATNNANDANGDLRFTPAAGSGDPRRAQVSAIRGKVLSIDQQRQVAVISLGEGDTVKKLMKFEVRAKAPANGKADEPVVKGTVEVIRVEQDRSEVRILKEDAANKIAKGDVVVPAADPVKESRAVRQRFSIVGKIDFDQSGRIDREKLRELIERSNAIIDNEVDDEGNRIPKEGKITAETKFLVVGEIADPKSITDPDQKQIAERIQQHYAAMRKEAIAQGVRIVKLEDFFAWGSVKKLGANSGDGVYLLKPTTRPIIGGGAIPDSKKPVSAKAPVDAKREVSFSIPDETIRWVKQIAATELQQRGDLKSRRPKGLEDLSTPEAIDRAFQQTMQGLAKDATSGEGQTRLRYLGDAVFDRLVKTAKLDDPNAAAWCCSALTYRGAKAVAPLSEILKESKHEAVRSAAATALGETFQPAGVPALIQALDDRPSVKHSVIFALLYLRDQRAVEPLKKHTEDKSLGHLVADALKHIAKPQGYAYWPPELLDVWQLCEDAHTLKGESFGAPEWDRLAAHVDSENHTVAGAAQLALGHLDVRSKVPAIIAAKTGYRFHVLAQLATPEAIDFLVASLSSRDPNQRKNILSELSQGAGRWAAPLLIALLDDDSLRAAARREKTFGEGEVEWPESHGAHSALYQYLYRFGLPGEMRNLYAHETNNVPEEIARLRTWWKTHGQDFVAGKAVPNPKLTSVWYYDP